MDEFRTLDWAQIGRDLYLQDRDDSVFHGNLKKPYNLILELSSNPNWLHIMDEFRTLDWKRIKIELSTISIYSPQLRDI
jgi:hypothetical protein